MASKPKSKRVAEVLTEKADEVFAALKTGQTLDEIGKPMGIYPFHITAFYASTPAFREPYRDALEVSAKMRAKARPKKLAPGAASAIIARNQGAILELLADGKLVTEIAAMYEVGRSAVSWYFTKHADQAVQAAYREALLEGGGAMADQATLASMRPAFDLVDAKMAELRARQLSWHAAKRDPAYADRQQVDLKGQITHNVSIDIST